MYKLQVLGLKNEEFPFLVHKLSVILTALQYDPQWKMGWNIQTPGYNDAHTVLLNLNLTQYLHKWENFKSRM